MKVFIDSNVLFSAARFPGSTPARALYKALTEPNDAIVCEINIDELKGSSNLQGGSCIRRRCDFDWR